MSSPAITADRTDSAQSRIRVPTSALRISVIVPVGPGDDSWRDLLKDLRILGPEDELILVGVTAPSTSMRQLRCPYRWLVSAPGRARQMNCGAAHARGEFLWFLHADSRVAEDAVLALRRAVADAPEALHYFDLKFLRDGPALVALTELGVRFRSRRLKMPFGDQGLCLARELFAALGQFDETVPYGEDHLLVWAARRHRLPLCRVEATLATSARKYRANGWFTTTLQHGWRTWRQAAPEFVGLLRDRWR